MPATTSLVAPFVILNYPTWGLFICTTNSSRAYTTPPHPSSASPSSVAAYIQAWVLEVTKICTYLKMNSPQLQREREKKRTRLQVC